MRQPWHIASVLVGGLLWTNGGCSSATLLSDDFGESTAAAVRGHRLPIVPTADGFVLEGQPAQHIMQRYIRSFDRSSSAGTVGLGGPSDGGSGGIVSGQ